MEQQKKTWKTTKYLYDGIYFMSQPEIEVYKILKASEFKFQYQPKAIQITKDFTTSMGVKHNGMKYEPDFVVYDEDETRYVYLEVKSQNDLVFAGKNIKDNSEVVRMKHKQIEQWFTRDRNKTITKEDGTTTTIRTEIGEHNSNFKDKFLVVRVNNLKTPEYAGAFWEEEFTKLKTYKTQKKLDLCASIKRIEQTLTEVMAGFYDN